MAEALRWMLALVPLLPLLAAAFIAAGFVIGLNRGEAAERYTSRLALLAAALSLLLLLGVDILLLREGTLPGQLRFGRWLSSGEFRIEISLLIDAPALLLAHLVTLVALLGMRFSVNYLHREAGFTRYFMVLSLFTGAMLLIAMAGNAVLTFVGWELAGLSSYLLIAWSWERPTATANATRAFVTNRFGDAGFILGIALALLGTGSVEWPLLLAGVADMDRFSAGLIASGFLLAAMAKSAQVPFAPWIGRALEGPTPSSAIFYGSLMVHAGVFLLIRLQPLLEHTPELMWMVALVGVVTALYGFFGGLVQTDVKSALMFSTTAQVGLMFFACGMGWFGLATWYLVLHASWRAFQFLSAPAMMHLIERPTRRVPAGLRKRRFLYTAALQRFWLEHITDWLLVGPTRALARDIQSFDQQVVNRLAGLPGSAGAVSSLAQWEKLKYAHSVSLDGDSGDVGRGRGAAGKLMEWIASMLYWFEEHLVLTGGDKGVRRLVLRVGDALMRVDELLSRPRYLLLMLVITFVVIL
jgi:NADH:ubiquinone oxidoreductase subunit 5 (subunit L)/multisubunit Na+/H+ antiporter MnhA subunit